VVRGSVNNRKTTLASLLRKVGTLRKALVYDRKEGCTLLPDGKPVGVCTNSALYLKTILGGLVVGYDHWANPTAEIGVAESGHDFLLMKKFIVDMWAAKIYGTPPVVRRSRAKLVRKLYGDPAQWRVWRHGKFEVVATNTSRKKVKPGAVPSRVISEDQPRDR
jgi:hypothetical protein